MAVEPLSVGRGFSGKDLRTPTAQFGVPAEGAISGISKKNPATERGHFLNLKIF
jgi:hypothetical protein